MKTTPWLWLVLLLIPGCLLVQPLDEAKPDSEDSAGEAGKPSAQAGSGGKQANGGRPGTGSGGTGNRGGSGPVAQGGAPAGGAPPAGEFAIFVGTWNVVDGSSKVSCDGGTTMTTPVTGGTSDTVELGTVSDLVFGPGNDCEILADVNNRTASLNPATAECYFNDTQYDYEQSIDSFQFVVSSNGQTATSRLVTTVYIYDSAGTFVSICDSDTSSNYAR